MKIELVCPFCGLRDEYKNQDNREYVLFYTACYGGCGKKYQIEVFTSDMVVRYRPAEEVKVSATPLYEIRTNGGQRIIDQSVQAVCMVSAMLSAKEIRGVMGGGADEIIHIRADGSRRKITKDSDELRKGEKICHAE